MNHKRDMQCPRTTLSTRYCTCGKRVPCKHGPCVPGTHFCACNQKRAERGAPLSVPIGLLLLRGKNVNCLSTTVCSSFYRQSTNSLDSLYKPCTHIEVFWSRATISVTCFTPSSSGYFWSVRLIYPTSYWWSLTFISADSTLRVVSDFDLHRNHTGAHDAYS